jgi:signal peptide peptidase SppA
MSDPTMSEHLRQMVLRGRAVLRPVLPRRWRAGATVVPVLRLSGVIGFSTPLRPGLTLAGLARALDRLFAVRRAAAVALVINSPGGSAVQSHLIFRRIRQLAAEKKVPVIVFVEDVAASGGYMIACAGDEIICDASSIVGSIGVVGATFGFDEAMKKLGIARRVYTSGDRKVTLDPFLPENPEDVERLKAIQHEIHDSFIDLVKERRAANLNGSDERLFSGEYWGARTALGLGLVDRIGDLRSYLREQYGEEVVTPLVSLERGLLGRRVPPGVGAFDDLWARAGFADEIISAIEARAMWGRYGL